MQLECSDTDSSDRSKYKQKKAAKLNAFNSVIISNKTNVKFVYISDLVEKNVYFL